MNFFYDLESEMTEPTNHSMINNNSMSDSKYKLIIL